MRDWRYLMIIRARVVVSAGTLASGSMLVIDPIPDNLIREPVEYLFADHVRQRSLCDLLRSLSEHGEADAGFAFEEALRYLEADYLNHIADEEEDLFPRLRERINEDDELHQLLEELETQHRRDRARGRGIADALRRMFHGAERRITEELRASLEAFVSGVMSHLTTEDERVLPLARSSLTEEDFERMGRAMARRRGVDYPA